MSGEDQLTPEREANDDRRRLRVVVMSRELVAELFRLNGRRIVLEGLPRDAALVGVSEESRFWLDQVCFKFQSSEFDPVLDGCAIPELVLTCHELPEPAPSAN